MSSLAKDDQIRLIFEDQLDRREITLPLLPEVAANVISLSTSEEVDAQQLANLIQGDMALAGHVMRVANSPIYRPVTPFVSLQQAITRLGIVTIGEIALATSLNSDLFEAPGYKNLLRHLWRQSLFCAAWSRQIAKMRRTNVETSFLAGMLCDMGKPIVIQAVADFAMDEPSLIDFAEGYYVRAGALLAALWQLPPAVSEVIIHHQHDEPDNVHREITLNVQAARQICTQGLEGLSEDLLLRLNFYPEDVESLRQATDSIQDWVETIGG
tara:strand:- start:1178 stop:1984 length:807 start_codon:yes stop_codon:yes gene_type:complete